MDFTTSANHGTAPNGQRKHTNASAPTTRVTDKDMNSVAWEIMEVIKAGVGAGAFAAPIAFDEANPASYSQMRSTIQALIANGSATAANNALAGHVAAADPHTQYVKKQATYVGTPVSWKAATSSVPESGAFLFQHPTLGDWPDSPTKGYSGTFGAIKSGFGGGQYDFELAAPYTSGVARLFFRAGNTASLTAANWSEAASTDALIGSIHFVASNVLPSVALPCNGMAFSAATYPKLAAIYPSLTTPNIPDGYSLQQASSLFGHLDAGEVISHNHSFTAYGSLNAGSPQSSGNTSSFSIIHPVSYTGGAINRAAGIRGVFYVIAQ